jgi:transglutaminase-like putative cysteine protease
MSSITQPNTSVRQSGGRLNRIVIVLMFIAFVAAGIYAWNQSRGDVATITQNGITDHQTLWQDNAIDDYRYTLNVGCFCLPEWRGPVTIEVRDGKTVSVTFVDSGEAAPADNFARYDTIDDLFVVLTDMQGQDPVTFDVTYDENTGVPTNVWVDVSEMMADEELGLTITDFMPLR